MSVSAILCALPLTAACEDAPTPSALALRARLEFETGESRAVGLLALDFDGDGADELVSLLRGPGAIQVVAGLSNRAEHIPRRVTLEVGDFSIGPVRVGAWKPGRDGGPAIVAIAQRAETALVLVDVRALFLGKSDAIVSRVELASRPRAIAAGDLGLDGIPEIAIATLDDELLIVTGGVVSAPFELRDSQSTCVHFTADGRSVLVGSQATRKIVRYVPSSPFRFELTGEVQLNGLPRRIDELDGWRGANGPTFFVAAGEGDLVRLDKDLRLLGIDEQVADRRRTHERLRLAAQPQTTGSVAEPGVEHDVAVHFTQKNGVEVAIAIDVAQRHAVRTLREPLSDALAQSVGRAAMHANRSIESAERDDVGPTVAVDVGDVDRVRRTARLRGARDIETAVGTAECDADAFRFAVRERGVQVSVTVEVSERGGGGMLAGVERRRRAVLALDAGSLPVHGDGEQRTLRRDPSVREIDRYGGGLVDAE